MFEMASFRNLGYCASTDEIGCGMLCQILPRHLNEFCSASSETTSKILWTCLTHASEKTAIHFCFHGRVEDERSQGRPRIRWMDVIKNCSRPILERRPSSLDIHVDIHVTYDGEPWWGCHSAAADISTSISVVVTAVSLFLLKYYYYYYYYWLPDW